MKKLFITIAAIALGAGAAFAQDLASLTELYNNGAMKLNDGDKVAALATFKQALTQAEALGEEGAEIVTNCKNVIPDIQFSIAKELVNNTKYDEAVAALKETVAIAEKFGDANVGESAKDLIPQVIFQKANELREAKDFAAAAAAFKEVLALDAANGNAALLLGTCLNSTGDKDGAIAAFEQAAANGKEELANKQLGNLYLKEAANDLKAKNYNGAIANALKVNEYGENAKAYQVAGQAAQSAGKNAAAIEYFEKYLELSPKAANAASIAFTVGALYQKAGNNAKAKEFYKKVVSDPKLGTQAQQLLNALK